MRSSVEGKSTRYRSIDVALGWPLRYAHSSAEVTDTRIWMRWERLPKCLRRTGELAPQNLIQEKVSFFLNHFSC